VAVEGGDFSTNSAGKFSKWGPKSRSPNRGPGRGCAGRPGAARNAIRACRQACIAGATGGRRPRGTPKRAPKKGRKTHPSGPARGTKVHGHLTSSDWQVWTIAKHKNISQPWPRRGRGQGGGRAGTRNAEGRSNEPLEPKWRQTARRPSHPGRPRGGPPRGEGVPPYTARFVRPTPKASPHKPFAVFCPPREK